MVKLDHGHEELTGRSSRRARKSAEKRERIRKAALELFALRGFDGVAVEEITEAADVGKGTFFTFFPTKCSVLADYYLEIESRFANATKRMDPEAPVASFLRLFRYAERLLTREASLMRTLVHEISANPDLGALDRRSGLDDIVRYTDFFRRAKRAGTLDSGVDERLAAEIVGAIWSSTVRAWFDEDRGFSLAQALGEKVTLLFRGFGPPVDERASVPEQ